MEGVRRVLSQFRVEPIQFLFGIGLLLQSIGSRTLINQKICFPEGPPGVDVICKENAALKEAASINQWMSHFRGLVPGLVTLFAGSWRDTTGLIRPLIIMSHIGEILSALAALASAEMWGASPWISALTESFFGGITGSRQLMAMASFVYITEHTSSEERANRLSLLGVANLSGISLAMALSGYLLAYLNYTRYFLLVLALFSVSLLSTFLLIKDGKRKDAAGSGGPLAALNKFNVIFQPKPNNFVIWLFISACILTITTLISEMGIVHVYLQKKFEFTPKQGGLYSSYKMILNLAVSAVSVPIFKKFFKMSDFRIVIVCALISSFSNIGMALSSERWLLYFFDGIEVFRITMITTLKSLLTKCLKKSETGVYTSFTSLGEGILPIVMSPLYTFVFYRTIDTMPGAFYFISCAMSILVAIIVSIGSFYYVEMKEEDKEVKDKKKEE